MSHNYKLDSLTAAEVNLMFAGLGKLPYEAVFKLVAKLEQQVRTQEQPQTVDEGNDSD